MTAAVTLPYEEYAELLDDVARFMAIETARKTPSESVYLGGEMKLIEITVNGQMGPTGLTEVTSTVVCDGQTTETTKEYKRGYLLFPVLRSLIKEINMMENAVVLVNTNIRRAEQGLQTLSEQDDGIYLQIRKIAEKNKLILITRYVKVVEP